MSLYPECYDVVVVGGGHAGTEAALAAARMGARTLLLSHSLETIGQMSCNPAIGGIGKGHLVREVDAMGGAMALAADRAGIQWRILNASRGPAVRATRCQADRQLYRQAIRSRLEAEPGLDLFQQAVDDLLVEGGRVVGVVTAMGLAIRAASVLLTTGTFLAGRLHIGLEQDVGGRAGEPAATRLADRLRELPLRVDRLKTGTPPRIDGRTIDYSRLEAQQGEERLPVMSFVGSVELHPPQVPCHITHTNPATHELIRSALDRSPIYSGVITASGPRYCPSIEDKIHRFADRNTHQVYLEPEGLNSYEVYPNGISTSLPFDVQWQLVRSMRGLERARITRPGYAIEYDYFDPRDLGPMLESRPLPGLWLAGQINGTTGYEEAAAQGLLAGINAAASALGREGWSPGREDAYLGVMVDDLITAGTREPYRMFTSRAEYRLRLREDNADLRLTPVARRLGLIDDDRWRRFEEKRESIEREQQRLRSTLIRPDRLPAGEAERVLGQALQRETTLMDLLRRPGVDYPSLMTLPGAGEAVADPAVAEQVGIEARYAGYIERQQVEIDRLKRYETHQIPDDLDYGAVRGLSAEVSEKLARQRPSTIGIASRIPGVTPAAVSLLLVHLRRRGAEGVTPV